MPSAAKQSGRTAPVLLRHAAPSSSTPRRLRGRVQHGARARDRARRAGCAPSGHASTKTRGEVRGGGAKPWKQKGTGRARAGSSRNPIWTGGGTVFGPQPRHYTFKVNRKARRVALRSALSVHAERGSIAVFDAGVFDAPSTKQAHELLAGWGAGRPRRSSCSPRASATPACRSATSTACSCCPPRTPASPTSSAPRACSSPRPRCRRLVARANGTDSEDGEK